MLLAAAQVNLPIFFQDKLLQRCFKQKKAGLEEWLKSLPEGTQRQYQSFITATENQMVISCASQHLETDKVLSALIDYILCGSRW